MEMSNFMPEFHHVAQQSRRDKLRVQNTNTNSSVTLASSSQQNLEDFHTSFQQRYHQNHHHYYVPHGASAVFPSELRENSTIPTYSSFVPQSVAYSDYYPSRFVVGSSTASKPREMGDFKPLTETWVARTSFGGGTATVGLASAGEHNYQNSSVQIWGNSSNGGNNNELPLLPASFISTQPENLSLSLSSHRIREIPGLGEEQEVKPQLLDQSGSISSVVNQSVGAKELSGSYTLQGDVHHNVGPLGPFTGYTTILKSSKFLRPAQYLLDEFLSVAGVARPVADVDDGLQSFSGSHYYNRAGNYSRFGLASKCSGSSDLSCHSGSESYKPDSHDKKAKLLHMQEELCKRHKQYHQQMQMVTSAFESVPGLANATPYISRSIKTISRHFRCLKNAIADQLTHIRKVLGEDLSSPTSFPKGDGTNLTFNNSFKKLKSGSHGGIGYQNHIWRPQRGLPERAVSILRAWLFDHFLHPYPTDTDKQLLASQTGLSRNQVSNWFINARVRLWKPMVEEIHMLDTKGMSHYESNSSSIETSADMNTKHITGNKSSMNALSDKQQLEYLGSSSSAQVARGAEEVITEQLFQKRSTMANHYPTPASDLDGPSFVGFLPYQRRSLEMGGIGAVSLTLGLRHGSETTQQQLQHHFQSQGMHFGGNIIQNFQAN